MRPIINSLNYKNKAVFFVNRIMDASFSYYYIYNRQIYF